MTRIQNRARVEGRWFEQDITEEYLRKLLAKYESLYEGREDRVDMTQLFECSTMGMAWDGLGWPGKAREAAVRFAGRHRDRFEHADR